MLPAPRNTTVTTETNLGGFYEDTVFVALATMPGNILSVLLTNVIGARVLLGEPDYDIMAYICLSLCVCVCVVEYSVCVCVYRFMCV